MRSREIENNSLNMQRNITGAQEKVNFLEADAVLVNHI